MTAIEHTGAQDDSTLPDDLPLLTEVVADDIPDAIPVLTEIISEPADAGMLSSSDGEATIETMETTAGLPLHDSPENNTSNIAARDDSSDLLDITAIPEADVSLPSPIDDEEMQQLLHQLETHIETVLREKLSRDTVLTEKLSSKLEQLQQLAITQAIDEIKAELPDMLRDALNARAKL